MVSCPPWAGDNFLCMFNEICIIINVNVFYFVFSAVFIGEGQKFKQNISLFGFIYVNLFYFDSKLLNTIENLNVFAFVFFHTILTVAQNTRMSLILNT